MSRINREQYWFETFWIFKIWMSGRCYRLAKINNWYSYGNLMVNGWLSWVRSIDKAILNVLEEQVENLVKTISKWKNTHINSMAGYSSKYNSVCIRSDYGVGPTTRLSAVSWRFGKQIVYAWVITILASAVVAGLILYIIIVFWYSCK